MRVIAFTKYGREAASTRQRVLQYVPALALAGIELEHHPLLSDDYVRSLATGEKFSKASIARSCANRLIELLRKPRCDLFWVYAELFPYLPAGFERLIFRSGVPVIYDFDDAFFLPYDEHPKRIVRWLLAGKLEPLISSAAAATCGNAFLRDYAARFCPCSKIFPTVVDTELYRSADREKEGHLTIGWIGSPSSWANVRPLLPSLEKVCREGKVRFRAIGAGFEAEADRFDGMDLVRWSEASEVTEVQRFDIGIMPLIDAPFQRGKSGYKLIQYMACGLPVVASPVGVNRQIVTQAQNGFLASSEAEWEEALNALIRDAGLRAQFGREGRRQVEAHYSLASQAPRLIELFRAVEQSGPTAP